MQISQDVSYLWIHKKKKKKKKKKIRLRISVWFSHSNFAQEIRIYGFLLNILILCPLHVIKSSSKDSLFTVFGRLSLVPPVSTAPLLAHFDSPSG